MGSIFRGLPVSLKCRDFWLAVICSGLRLSGMSLFLLKAEHHLQSRFPWSTTPVPLPTVPLPLDELEIVMRTPTQSLSELNGHTHKSTIVWSLSNGSRGLAVLLRGWKLGTWVLDLVCTAVQVFIVRSVRLHLHYTLAVQRSIFPPARISQQIRKA